MNESITSCQYQDPDGFVCREQANESGYCFWHDRKANKTGADVKEQLVAYIRSGGLARGIFLKNADLTDIDLVNHHRTNGFDFSYADFYRANLSGAHLFNINLSHASLMKVDLTEAKLNCGNLTGCNLLGVKWKDCKIENIEYGKVLPQETKAKLALKAKKPNEALDYYQQAEEIYRDLRKHAEQEGLFSIGGELIQKELTMRRYQMPKYSLRRASSKIVDLFCGYGEDPLRIVALSILIILICALCYTFTGLSYQGEILRYQTSKNFMQNLSFFGSCLYYSVVTFTTLGYGDFTPVGLSRAIAALQAFTGSFTIALFVVVFVKKMTR